MLFPWPSPSWLACGGLCRRFNAHRRREPLEAKFPYHAAASVMQRPGCGRCFLRRRLAPLPLERLVLPANKASKANSGWTIEFDASAYGGGAVLKNSSGAVEE